jgi:hypothetical protein
MRKFIERVTVTGADDSTSIDSMINVSSECGYVEWGILLSKSSEGRYRFPSLAWMEKLAAAKKANPSMKLSGHLCGKWVRDLCIGSWTFVADRPGLIDMFDRIQLNFHAIAHTVNAEDLAKALNQYPHIQYILQLDGVNNDILPKLKALGVNAVALFDISGGAGILPDEWPESNGFQGYAGGLSPENAAAQIEVISSKAKTNVWIDAETKLRTADDSKFVMPKVEDFLLAAAPWVIGAE